MLLRADPPSSEMHLVMIRVGIIAKVYHEAVQRLALALMVAVSRCAGRY